MPEEQDKKVIAVMGATGFQGGSVVEALLSVSDKFAIRAITRNPDSDKAKALAEKGIEVVKADADDEETMVKALSGAYGAFLVTNFWADMSMAHEIEQTDKLQKAAIAAKVEHVVLSTLEDSRPVIEAADDTDTWPVLDEALKSYVPHFDGKGEAGERFLASEAPTTLLFTSFYYENFINFGMAPTKHGEDAPLAITLPIDDKPIPMNSLKDIGLTVAGILQDPSTINTRKGVASAFHTGQEMADFFGKTLGEPVVFNAVSPSVYASFGFPGANDLANMFRFWTTFEPVHRDVAGVEKLVGGKTDSLAAWIEENKAAFK
mmetsp:Transcript_27340/g.58495  ORF Transcript_27340/g.58495 Transcript_27340/m.58495 type:complete len:319 (+) Transcript_27340:125-1081(+)|eukprot:CAMPEP_0201232974 /NCGR_PEP_ID=MMETSP0852-20130820/4808_1 /ASSEMBLY_ACC=CAM_ASM_000632 /TAXON_ID=183588 /ORGANISM="Pseudo-nitzschia fraudulenta, Strain WWA7" /LENGTH=318 /DNA_ID=CAMNT_0047525621 /DNA_START=86 /DNA_END=1042 /DNA_ORIENTATION=-